jgi:hypothetical protein
MRQRLDAKVAAHRLAGGWRSRHHLIGLDGEADVPVPALAGERHAQDLGVGRKRPVVVKADRAVKTLEPDAVALVPQACGLKQAEGVPARDWLEA